MGVLAPEAACFGSVVDEDKRGAGVVFPEGFEFGKVEPGFGDGVYEDEVIALERLGDLIGKEQTGMGSAEAFDFFFEGVSKAFFDGAIEYLTVVHGQVVGKTQTKRGLSGLGKSIDHGRKTHGWVSEELPVFALEPDGLKLHAQKLPGGDYTAIKGRRRVVFFF